MNIDSDLTHTGILRYSFEKHTKNEQESTETVTISEVEKAYYQMYISGKNGSSSFVKIYTNAAKRETKYFAAFVQ